MAPHQQHIPLLPLEVLQGIQKPSAGVLLPGLADIGVDVFERSREEPREDRFPLLD